VTTKRVCCGAWASQERQTRQFEGDHLTGLRTEKEVFREEGELRKRNFAGFMERRFQSLPRRKKIQKKEEGMQGDAMVNCAELGGLCKSDLILGHRRFDTFKLGEKLIEKKEA